MRKQEVKVNEKNLPFFGKFKYFPNFGKYYRSAVDKIASPFNSSFFNDNTI